MFPASFRFGGQGEIPSQSTSDHAFSKAFARAKSLEVGIPTDEQQMDALMFGHVDERTERSFILIQTPYGDILIPQEIHCELTADMRVQAKHKIQEPLGYTGLHFTWHMDPQNLQLERVCDQDLKTFFHRDFGPLDICRLTSHCEMEADIIQCLMPGAWTEWMMSDEEELPLDQPAVELLKLWESAVFRFVEVALPFYYGWCRWMGRNRTFGRFLRTMFDLQDRKQVWELLVSEQYDLVGHEDYFFYVCEPQYWQNTIRIILALLH